MDRWILVSLSLLLCLGAPKTGCCDFENGTDSIEDTGSPRVPSDFRICLDECLVLAFQSALDEYAAKLEEAGAVMAVHIPGQGFWAGAAGNADKGQRVRDEQRNIIRVGVVPMRVDDRFLTCSISKMFVSACVLRLVEEGKVALDDVLGTLVPGIELDHSDRITVRQLLNHTSGVPCYERSNPMAFWTTLLMDPSQKLTPEDLVSRVADREFLFQPGQEGKWYYSNTNYVLLVMLVEAVTGSAIEEEMHRLIFDPLGLDDTYYGGREEIPGGRVAEYYVGSKFYDWDLSWFLGPGNIVSTAEDLAVFANGLFSGRLLNRDSLQTMLEPVPANGFDYCDSYALGLMIFNDTFKGSHALYGDLVGHTGSNPGVNTVLIHGVKNGVTIVALSNNDKSADAGKVFPPVNNALEVIETYGYGDTGVDWCSYR